MNQKREEEKVSKILSFFLFFEYKHCNFSHNFGNVFEFLVIEKMELIVSENVIDKQVILFNTSNWQRCFKICCEIPYKNCTATF